MDKVNKQRRSYTTEPKSQEINLDWDHYRHFIKPIERRTDLMLVICLNTSKTTPEILDS